MLGKVSRISGGVREFYFRKKKKSVKTFFIPFECSKKNFIDHLIPMCPVGLMFIGNGLQYCIYLLCINIT